MLYFKGFLYVDKDEKKFEKRIESEALLMESVTNKDLTCRDCIFMLDDSEIFGNVSRCRVYSVKPNKVLLGKSCNRKQKR